MQAMAPLESSLTSDEKARNAFSIPHAFHFNDAERYTFKSPSGTLPDISPCKVTSIQLSSPHCKPGRPHKYLCEGLNLSLIRPGFPSFRSRTFSYLLKEVNVIVFEYASRGKSMVLSITPEGFVICLHLLLSWVNFRVKVSARSAIWAVCCKFDRNYMSRALASSCLSP